MKKIQYFKLFESRTAELSEEEFFKILKEKCRDWISDPVYLQRAKNRLDGEFTYINPKIHFREPFIDKDSGVASKHHTLLMDNLPSWDGFCKRSESIIFISKPLLTSSFGAYYYFVIPYDNANFSMAPGMDLWASGADIFINDDSYDDFFSYKFDSVFSESMMDYSISDKSYDDMLFDLNKLFNDYIFYDYPHNKQSKKVIRHKFFTILFDRMLIDNYSEVSDALNDYFSPKKFHAMGKKEFKNMDYNDMKNDLGGLTINNSAREIWTDSECLLVYCGNNPSTQTLYDKFNSFIKNLS